jgi:hypothetical protein
VKEISMIDQERLEEALGWLRDARKRFRKAYADAVAVLDDDVFWAVIQWADAFEGADRKPPSAAVLDPLAYLLPGLDKDWDSREEVTKALDKIQEVYPKVRAAFRKLQREAVES